MPSNGSGSLNMSLFITIIIHLIIGIGCVLNRSVGSLKSMLTLLISQSLVRFQVVRLSTGLDLAYGNSARLSGS